MPTLFGTDGVRGVANELLTPLLALKMGVTAAHVLRSGEAAPMVLVGRDTRLSGSMLEAGLVAGLCAAGANVTLLGVVPTPAVAYLTRKFGADAGVVISASHNDFTDNGIKFLGADGCKLADDTEDAIEKQLNNWEAMANARAEKIGHVLDGGEMVSDYLQHLRESIDCTLDGLKIVVDAAHGANSEVAPRLLASLGADVITINCSPDGTNINKDCGSLHPEMMLQTVVQRGAQCGICFDGDADRVIMGDENGAEVDGDRMMAIAAKHFKQAGRLRGNLLVATIMSNLGLDDAMEKYGVSVQRTTVGDRYVAERMRSTSASLGGEKSGHIIFTEYATTGDGLLTALQMLAIMQKTGKSMSDLAGIMQEYPQRLLSMRVKNKDAWALSPEAAKYEQWGLDQLGEPSRVNIRASGTEPKVRVMVEAGDSQKVEEVASALAEKVLAVCGKLED
ncbi:MAG: phosphoglucosamine mutase [Armatimonadota bacterium]